MSKQRALSYRYTSLIVLTLMSGTMIMYALRSKEHVSAQVTSVNDVAAIFPKTVEEINERAEKAMAGIRAQVQAIIAIPDEERTFANTALALDRMELSDFAILAASLQSLELISPDAALRAAASEVSTKLQNFWVDEVSYNLALYHAFKAYLKKKTELDDLSLARDKDEYRAHRGAAAADADAHFANDPRVLSAEQCYYLQEKNADYKRQGLDLDDAARAQVQTLQKELAKLSQDFDNTIANDNRTIAVSLDDLRGVDQDFITSLKKTDDGLYIVGVDYPSMAVVLGHCAVEQTRKKLYEAFSNRAYPTNNDLLKKIIAKRDELAKCLGFVNYAALDLDDQMVETPARAHQFLDELAVRAAVKERQEYERLISDLPESVALTKEGTFKPWDLQYAKVQYKKKHFALDDRLVAEYFPMQKTIDGLLDIYHQFLSLDFKIIPAKGLFWHEDVQLVQVSHAGKADVIGYLLLDLHPRPNKYSHACHQTVIPAVFGAQGEAFPEVSLVIANFPKSTATKPALLKFTDVTTFFHEFGHAVHCLLGRTHMASLAGTRVKRDFVEMPSQMLEEWLNDKAIVQKVSGHYQTGAPMPDAMIDTIIDLEQFDSGYFVQRQIMLSKLALSYFSQAIVDNPQQVLRDLHLQITPHVMFSDMNNMHTAFGHLTGYGAKYYGYLWSRVFALDMFEYIKNQENGLLNPAVGNRYKQCVISRGGSANPNELIRDFLSREPNQEAFFKSLGL